MSSGSISGMITSLRNNKRRRPSRFDKKKKSSKLNSYGEFVDHKKMKTHEYAEFQKKLFKDKKRQRFITRLIMIVTFVGTGLIVYFLGYLFNLLIGG